jgi:phosphotransferase system HPr-like phosphotransfer protein
VALDITGTVTVRPGESFALTPSVSPATANAALTWKSSNAKVAVVNAGGMVTAIGKGTAKITVQDANYKKVKATFTVKVTATGANTNKDLTTAYGMTAKQAEKRFGIKHSGIGQARTDGAYNFWMVKKAKDGSEIRLKAVGPTFEQAVVVFGMFNDGSYNLAGVKFGMRFEDAIALLSSTGWNCSDVSLDSDGTHIATPQKGNLSLWITAWPDDYSSGVQGGTISSLEFGYDDGNYIE